MRNILLVGALLCSVPAYADSIHQRDVGSAGFTESQWNNDDDRIVLMGGDDRDRDDKAIATPEPSAALMVIAVTVGVLLWKRKGAAWRNADSGSTYGG